MAEEKPKINPNAKLTEIIKTRRYRLTKKRPRSQKAIFKLDRGKVEQTITLFFPPSTQVRSHENQKEPNPNLFRINFGQISLIYYKDSKRGFVYDKDSTYCGSYEKHDLKHLFHQIGALLLTEKNKNGYCTVYTNKKQKKRGK